MTTSKDKSDGWDFRENDADGLDQFSNPFAFDKASGEQHCHSFAGRLRGCMRACLNSIADDSDPGVNAGTVLTEKLAFIVREADHAVGAIDHHFLISPLSNA